MNWHLAPTRNVVSHGNRIELKKNKIKKKKRTELNVFNLFATQSNQKKRKHTGEGVIHIKSVSKLADTFWYFR